ncbi:MULTISPECIES: queuosine precursor transporter [Halocynthiibacter]|uniref:Probable queuosine precursor transporter n=1 Tax=Halocynthiibacter halioticoli TaxID=2986804 RepID=A0AAE3LS68_9RHOB|nr:MULTISPECIES: queuosine precursor transporter [Halocynthiibacter]MCV6823016.1 queuosine precursor transporter [Halocynthiibacter halioticoli]MCW4056017.1 queuosine precursor transporter [Halocynthiibacter sp. SDUM655004]MDE0591413.1 queuosine precursor transporter [Halocynthiibacter sp. C4]
MTRLLPGVIAMAAIVVASNILVQFLLGDWLTWGALTYPLAFLVTDIMNRVYGASAARRVVFVGFCVGVACSLIGSQIHGEYGPLVALRVAVASAVAFLSAQLLDVAIFDRLRSGAWWRAPLASTLFGSVLDTVLFFTIAFSASVTIFGANADAAISWAWEGVPFLGFGGVVPLWVSLAFADWLVKLALALIALVPFRLIVTKLHPNVA